MLPVKVRAVSHAHDAPRVGPDLSWQPVLLTYTPVPAPSSNTHDNKHKHHTHASPIVYNCHDDQSLKLPTDSPNCYPAHARARNCFSAFRRRCAVNSRGLLLLEGAFASHLEASPTSLCTRSMRHYHEHSETITPHPSPRRPLLLPHSPALHCYTIREL